MNEIKTSQLVNKKLKYGFCKKSLRKNETLTSCPFFPFFFITFGWVQQQNQPEVIKEMEKMGNWSEFHFSEVTSYKIHTLGNFTVMYTHGYFSGWNSDQLFKNSCT